MLAFLLITAHLSVPVNDQRLMLNSAVAAAAAEVKARTIPDCRWSDVLWEISGSTRTSDRQSN
jgi:hypothetical protein